ncbi:S8 family serine peptidase [Micromonospora sp. NPDC050397]|uniref:S8 family serine peptidase n=1 Tax=Micromonospora sp. NPDC050397 TaxID=3364279 RepID=UPI00384FA170
MRSASRTRPSPHPLGAGLLCALVLLVSALFGATGSVPGGTPGANPGADRAKIDVGLSRSLATGGTADFLVTFGDRTARDRSELDTAAATADWAERGAAVLATLRRQADRSQRAVRAQLSDAGTRYRAFHVANAVYVFGGDRDLADRLSRRSEVHGLYPARTHALPEPRPGDPTVTARAAADEVEWGVADIGADRVWREYGDRGEGIVVANIDSGVQYDHPALVGTYRGNHGDGAFDHDYNWYDPAAICQAGRVEPCDNSGHGTHTMGTMVGDGGAGNRIGVAPGARWIAAKGCEASSCSDFALLASAEWMLAPTDSAGANPLPSMRPNIVNNSWGEDNGAEENPWFDQVLGAWLASGIFPMFSNGNAGPGCDTAGTPGDSLLTYSTGMYDVNGVIDPWSSRGPGADGDPKPNISAPGTDVRSAVPGSGYGAKTGTSMASPHVAGAIALLWSAAPTLVGDIPATRALLDRTAVDVDDTSCGGTPADNNVYGEGRLDVYAAVTAAPRAAAGRIRGTVTDATSGAPLSGAVLTLAGVANRTLGTDAKGGFDALVPVGDYTVGATAFGYDSQTASVTVTATGAATHDFKLTALDTVTVSGRVTEGSDHRWPLYATVSVAGVPNGTVHTKPSDGSYRFTVPAGRRYQVMVNALYPGLQPVSAAVEVAGRNLVRDFTLPVDRYACVAPGYREQEPDQRYAQSFDGEVAPPDWTVTDAAGTGQVWRYDSTESNRTGGGGGFASVESSSYGMESRQDTTLVSPVLDLTGTGTPAVWFDTHYETGQQSSASVDVSVDGGGTWATAWRRTTEALRGPAEVRVPIPQAANQSRVRIRFHYDAVFDLRWQVDDVRVGDRRCVAVPGGLLSGAVTDRNTGAALTGATVRPVGHPELTTTTVATGADPGLDDGFYWLFAPLEGVTQVRTTLDRYHPQTKPVTVAADAVTKLNFSLGAGQVGVAESTLDASVTLGGSGRATLTVRNDGSAPAELDLVEEATGGSAVTGAGAARQRIPGDYPLGPVRPATAKPSTSATTAKPSTSAAAPASVTVTGGAAPWATIPDYPIAVMDNAVATRDGRVYSVGGSGAAGPVTDVFAYDTGGTGWQTLAPLPRARQKPAVGWLGDRLYVVGGWGTSGDPRFDVDVYDPHTNTWSTGPAAPEARAGAATAVLDGRLYLVGGCVSGFCGSNTVLRFDPAARTWSRLANYPKNTAWAACGGIAGQLYCAGGATETVTSASTYRYDPSADTWTAVARLPIDLWGMAYAVSDGRLLVSGGVTNRSEELTNEGFAYDPETDTWSTLPNSTYALYRGGSGCGLYKIGGAATAGLGTRLAETLPGYANCGGGDAVPWLRTEPGRITVPAGGTVEVEVTFDAARLDQPGSYAARLVLRAGTPYDTVTVPVRLTVAPPAGWGRLTGTVTGSDCSGTRTPVPGATVRVTSGTAAYHLRTDAAGGYGIWLDPAAGPPELLVVADGSFPHQDTVTLAPGATVVHDVTLDPTGCVTAGRTS